MAKPIAKPINDLIRDLQEAYIEKDPKKFADALDEIMKDIDFLRREVVRYREALNFIAWPPHFPDPRNRSPRQIAVDYLDISKINPPKDTQKSQG